MGQRADLMARRVNRGGRTPRRFRPHTLARLTHAITCIVVDGVTIAEAGRRAGMHDMALRNVLWELRGDWTSHPTLRDAVCVACVARGWSQSHVARVTGVPVSTVRRASRAAVAASSAEAL